jgi:hypothetical protein
MGVILREFIGLRDVGQEFFEIKKPVVGATGF